jgi:uncharacterized protein YndB with AHSA1/START domain
MEKITVRTDVLADAVKAWEYFTSPEHITKWNFASADWTCPRAESDLVPGGKFSYRMEAADGSIGFDFEGTFEDVTPGKLLSYSMSDGRKVRVEFLEDGGSTEVVETFDAEEVNSLDLQRSGWQAILDNFKKHVEAA